MGKDTVGKLSYELLRGDDYADHSVGEQMSEQLKDYESNIYQCVDRGKADYTGDFYIVVITKRERLMPNVMRQYFFHRLSCPTPDYDQTLYKYNRKDDQIEFVWVVPAKPVVEEMRDNRTQMDLSLQELLKFVLDFCDGTLDQKARSLNNEPLIKKEMVI